MLTDLFKVFQTVSNAPNDGTHDTECCNFVSFTLIGGSSGCNLFNKVASVFGDQRCSNWDTRERELILVSMIDSIKQRWIKRVNFLKKESKKSSKYIDHWKIGNNIIEWFHKIFTSVLDFFRIKLFDLRYLKIKWKSRKIYTLVGMDLCWSISLSVIENDINEFKGRMNFTDSSKIVCHILMRKGGGESEMSCSKLWKFPIWNRKWFQAKIDSKIRLQTNDCFIKDTPLKNTIPLLFYHG